MSSPIAGDMMEQIIALADTAFYTTKAKYGKDALLAAATICVQTEWLMSEEDNTMQPWSDLRP